MSLMPLLYFHLVPQSVVLFRFDLRQSMLLKTQTDPLTGRDSDIIQIWKGHHHFARGHIRRSPAGFIIFNVQLAKKKERKKEWKHQNNAEAQMWLWLCHVGREFSAYYRRAVSSNWVEFLFSFKDGDDHYYWTSSPLRANLNSIFQKIHASVCSKKEKVQNWEQTSLSHWILIFHTVIYHRVAFEYWRHSRW